MSSNLKVNTILPSTGTAIGIGTLSGNVDVLGHIVGHNTPNISGINSVTASHFYGDGSNLTGISAGTSLSGSTNNTVCTVTGANAIQGEANLTFDGTTLKAETGNPVLELSGTTSNGGNTTIHINANANHWVLEADNYTSQNIFSIKSGTPASSTARLSIDSSGNIGLGAINNSSYDTNARNVLIASSGNTGITVRSGGSSNYGMIHFADGTSGSAEQRAGRILYEHSTDSLQFSTANTYALKIDSGQRLLIGHTITDNRDGYNSAVQIGGTSGDGASICIGRYSANVSYSALILSKSRSATVGGHTRVNTGDYLGGIQFQGDDGTRFLVGASIVAQAASPVADYDMATDLVISTNYGTTSPSKSMTFDHQGRLTKPNTPFVMVHIQTTSNRNSTSGYFTIPWDIIHARSTSSNVGSHFNTSNHRFTAPVDGRYFFCMSLNIVGDNIVKHRINGADVSQAEYRSQDDNQWDHADASFIYDMNANDYYDVVSSLSGSGQRWNGGSNGTTGWDTLSIYLLG